jgi:hypothetical protein
MAPVAVEIDLFRSDNAQRTLFVHSSRQASTDLRQSSMIAPSFLSSVGRYNVAFKAIS